MVERPRGPEDREMRDLERLLLTGANGHLGRRLIGELAGGSEYRASIRAVVRSERAADAAPCEAGASLDYVPPTRYLHEHPQHCEVEQHKRHDHRQNHLQERSHGNLPMTCRPSSILRAPRPLKPPTRRILAHRPEPSLGTHTEKPR